MKTKRWDADSQEIEIQGKFFLVFASFNWERDAIDYQFDSRAGQGRDMLADVPHSVESLEVFGPEEDGEAVEISLLPVIKEKVLEEFAASERGKKNATWGDWM